MFIATTSQYEVVAKLSLNWPVPQKTDHLKK
ncbi:hypothetical protein CPS_0270 [Colwellia psychrerythraea 34H]|uniref:Uncharacterized protein n=1 Tax=Colwellia psychrerythraea (strain 34H / ATCC BAA-681) TaxID=167879 RepID=Q48A76_COLP3|nr:hypothetical protein CPS_0270 [Colwellia psychrerythraea 34H]